MKIVNSLLEVESSSMLRPAAGEEQEGCIPECMDGERDDNLSTNREQEDSSVHAGELISRAFISDGGKKRSSSPEREGKAGLPGSSLLFHPRSSMSEFQSYGDKGIANLASEESTWASLDEGEQQPASDNSPLSDYLRNSRAGHYSQAEGTVVAPVTLSVVPPHRLGGTGRPSPGTWVAMDQDIREARASQEEMQIFNNDAHQWPPRFYACSFCTREFRTAQALGGHMNVHRRERAQANQMAMLRTAPDAATLASSDAPPPPPPPPPSTPPPPSLVSDFLYPVPMSVNRRADRGTADSQLWKLHSLPTDHMPTADSCRLHAARPTVTSSTQTEMLDFSTVRQQFFDGEVQELVHLTAYFTRPPSTKSVSADNEMWSRGRMKCESTGNAFFPVYPASSSPTSPLPFLGQEQEDSERPQTYPSEKKRLRLSRLNTTRVDPFRGYGIHDSSGTVAESSPTPPPALDLELRL